MPAKAAATTDTKPMWQSVTLWGSLFTIIGTVVFPMFKLAPPPTDAIQSFTDSFMNALDAVLSFGGMVMTVWGRIRSTTPVSLTGGPKPVATLLFLIVAPGLLSLFLLTPAGAQNLDRTVDIQPGTHLLIVVNGQRVLDHYASPGRAHISVQYLAADVPASVHRFHRPGHIH